ncbi:esterase/lipase family protein [Streptomyces anulatus]
MADKPAIVLVHGFWGGAAHWAKVITELHRRGFGSLHAVENPLTSLADDAERTRKMVRQIDGPVVLVGHSYGGAVITEAGDLPNVTGLVYIAAFAPDAGESPGQISQEKPPRRLREPRPGLRRLPVGQAGQVPRELRPGPVRGGGAGDGGDPEGAAGLDVR